MQIMTDLELDDIRINESEKEFIKDILVPGKITVIVAPPKNGKSIFALNLAYATLAGKDIAGLPSPNRRAKRVWYVHAPSELSRSDKKEIRQKLGKYYCTEEQSANFKWICLDEAETPIDVLKSDSIGKLPHILIIDSVTSTIPSKVKNDVMECVAPYAQELQTLAGPRCAIVLIMHTTKKDRGAKWSKGYMPAGSFAWMAIARFRISIKRMPRDEFLIHTSGNVKTEHEIQLVGDYETLLFRDLTKKEAKGKVNGILKLYYENKDTLIKNGEISKETLTDFTKNLIKKGPKNGYGRTAVFEARAKFVKSLP